MHTKHKYDSIVFLSVIGFGISLYLTITHYMGVAVPCSITHGCEAVLTSKYSMLFGFPLSLWGIGFFISVVFSALLANHYSQWRKILTVVLGGGSLASLIFLSLQFFVIKKVCQYCLTADLLTILLLIIDLNLNLSRQNSKN